MKISSDAVFIVMIFMLLSCGSTYEIVSHSNVNSNFNNYSSYAIIHDDHGFEKGIDTTNRKIIDDAVEREVELMGYVSSTSPDIEISWFIKEDTKLEKGIYNSYYSKWRSQRTLDVYEYQVGTLVIDIVEKKSGEIIWHGKISDNMDDPFQSSESKIKKLISDVFVKYKKDVGFDQVQKSLN